MKAILVPIEEHERMASTLETALLLARKFDSYIEGLALRSNMTGIYETEFGGAAIDALEEREAKWMKRSRSFFEQFMQQHDVPRSEQPNAVLSYGWNDAAPPVDTFVGSYGRVFDVTILGRPQKGIPNPRMITLETSLFESGRPVLVAPALPARRIGDNVLIAWNGSTEQARATGLAMPILQKATEVIVLTVEGATLDGPRGNKFRAILNGTEFAPSFAPSVQKVAALVKKSWQLQTL